MPQINSPTPDATTTTKGKIQLAGFLGGSASLPLLNTGAANATVATSETTTSTTYTDLTTTTDSVTVTIGANGLALVTIYANISNSANTTLSYVGFAASGANTIASTDTQSLQYLTSAATGLTAGSAIFLLTGLVAGSTTFKMKYRVGAGTGTFINRRIAVVPL